MTNSRMVVVAALAATAAVITHNRAQARKVAIDMGVVKDTLNQINANIQEGREELLRKIDDLAARDHLDAEDKAALEEVRVAAESLANIVPNAVTDPLPDPDTAPEVGGDEPVVDPAAPVDETPAPEAPADAPVEDTPEAPAPETPADTGTVGDAPAGDVATETPATDDSATGDAGAADDEPTA